MIKRLLSLVLLVSFTFAVFAQPVGYYDNAAGKTGAELKTTLYNIIKGHTDLGYDGLYSAYTTSDNLPSGKVWDMYSIKADGTASYWFAHASADRCGSYSGEGDCYNREHTFCDSWLGKASLQRSDAHHILPTDGYVNNRRSSFPHGKVGSTSWTSSNGSKLGSSDASTGYSGTVFEPIDEFKGDFARMYFYVATRYEDKIAGWASNGSAGEILAGNSYPAYKTWFKDLMLQWSQQDPVSQKEIDRNNAIYNLQHNRNPFIDHPEYAEAVWSNGPVVLNFTSSPITTITINQLYTYSVSVTGPVGSTFTITPTTKPAWLTLTSGSNGHATLSGTPTSVGSFDVTLSVTDGTSTKTQTFAIQVAALEGLKFTSTSTLSATAGSLYNYNVTTSDNANPSATITITTTAKPDWLTISSVSNGTATLSGTPLPADVGANSVTLSATDGSTTVTQTFIVTVGVAGVGKTETFENMPTASPSSYSNRSWVGDNSINWTATLARTDQTINTKAICFKADATADLLSGTISGGCSQISFKHQQMFTGSGGSITLFINDQQIGSPVSVATTIQTAVINNFNVTGNFTIKLVSNGVSRIAIDDLSWVGASAVSNISPIVTNITNIPIYPTTTDDVVISANITDSDGTIKEAILKWGLSESNLNSTLPMALDGDVYKATIPKQSAGTIYLSVNAKDNLDSITTVLYNYEVIQNETPAISNITNNPLTPVTGQTIKIAATITDSDGSIEDAWLKWGTSSSNLSNQVTLALVGGSYEAIIPARSQIETIYLSINARDDLGSVSTSLYNFSIAQANLFPQITNIVKTPQNPLTGQSIKVAATITDSDGSIQEAYIKWGTSSSNLTNQIAMSLVSGDYETTIPAQTQAGIVYFSVNAKDNLDSITTVSTNLTVAANQAPVITNLSNSPQIPLTGQPVEVSATITDTDGSIQESFIKWGITALNLENILPMTFTGAVYKATIPSQSQAGTIYISVNAKDNLDAVSTFLYNYSVAQNQSPIISNILNSPQSPLTGESVGVSATISDSDGTIKEAWLKWGTSELSLENTLSMTLEGGVYKATIPALASAGAIYISVNAKDNLDSITTVSTSFTVAANQTPVIMNISNSPQSPLTGQPVEISATITDSDGSIQESFIKWGITALNLENILPMTFDGSVYKATIPSLSQAGTIYISVNAKDNLDAVSTILYNYSVAQNQSPVITNISNSPLNPTTDQIVTISATISDSDGTIQEVWFDWGNISNNLSNRVNMTSSNGNYVGTIPAQSQAGAIFLSISAKDNLVATTSTLSSFVVSPSTNVNNEDDNSRVKVYPNPAKNLIYVEVNITSASITISNIIGETILKMPYNGGKQPIDISRLKAGIYFIILTGDGIKTTTRIMIY